MNPTFAHLSKQSLFLVWGPPSYGPRSKVITRELGLKTIHFVYSITRRGFWAALVKYSYQTVKTLKLLFQERPKIVFVQTRLALPYSVFIYIVY